MCCIWFVCQNRILSHNQKEKKTFIQRVVSNVYWMVHCILLLLLSGRIVPEEVPHLHMNVGAQWLLCGPDISYKVCHDSTTDKMMSTRLLTLLNPHPVKRSLPVICNTYVSNLRRHRENVTIAFCRSGHCFNKRTERKQGIWSASSAGNRFFSFTPAGIVNAAPASIQPYLRLMRLDKPIGEMILMLWLNLTSQ